MIDMNDENRDTYEILSRYYDLEFDAFELDIDMYHQFAVNAGGPVLEIGCGSGRVLASLTDLNLPLAGIDNSRSMLDIARARLSPKVELVECDMRRLSEPDALPNAPYWFAFSAINTFLHLPDVESQLMTLDGLRSVVVSGGILLLDLFVPHPDYLVTLDGRLAHEFKTLLPDGTRIDKWAARTHDLASQTIDTTVFFDATSETGQVTRFVDRYSTRYIHLFELEHLLARAEWEIVSIYGGYDLEPFDSDSERIIVLATTNAGAAG
jgi:SAM-dependent methyltransferase